MKTKLEMMVAYLAGRKGEAADLIRRELDDPTSEVSLCFEAVRSRSRGLFGADPPEMPVLIPSRSIRKRETARGMARTRLPSLFLGAAAAALVFIAVGMAWRAQTNRFHHLEATLETREARWGDRFNRLEAALAKREAPSKGLPARPNGPNVQEIKPTTPADGPTSLALARIEARLGQLGQPPAQGPAPIQDDQQVAQLQRDLDVLRQELKTASRASGQASQELNGAVREILQLLRRLMMQSRAAGPMQVPVPIPVPTHGLEPGLGQGSGMLPGPTHVPGQAQMPGQDPSFGATGRGKR